MIFTNVSTVDLKCTLFKRREETLQTIESDTLVKARDHGNPKTLILEIIIKVYKCVKG